MGYKIELVRYEMVKSRAILAKRLELVELGQLPLSGLGAVLLEEAQEKVEIAQERFIILTDGITESSEKIVPYAQIVNSHC
jgi:hypothetical protein